MVLRFALNWATVVEETQVSGREFQSLTVLRKNDCLKRSVLQEICLMVSQSPTGFLSLFLSLSVRLSVFLSVSLSGFFSLCLCSSVGLSVCVSDRLLLSLSLFVCRSLSVCLSQASSLPVSFSLVVSSSLSLSVSHTLSQHTKTIKIPLCNLNNVLYIYNAQNMRSIWCDAKKWTQYTFFRCVVLMVDNM